MGNWCDQTQSNSSANEERQTSSHTGCAGTSGKRVCKRAGAKPGEICQWRTAGRRSCHLPLRISVTVPAAKPPPEQQPRTAVRWWSRRHSEKLHKETRIHGMGWVEGQLLLSSPDTGGTEGLRHMMRQWKPCTPYPGWWPKDKTVFSISLLENSPWSELNSRSERACVADLQTCLLLLPPACAGKKHFLTETSMELSLCEHYKYIYIYRLSNLSNIRSR